VALAWLEPEIRRPFERRVFCLLGVPLRIQWDHTDDQSKVGATEGSPNSYWASSHPHGLPVVQQEGSWTSSCKRSGLQSTRHAKPGSPHRIERAPPPSRVPARLRSLARPVERRRSTGSLGPCHPQTKGSALNLGALPTWPPLHVALPIARALLSPGPAHRWRLYTDRARPQGLLTATSPANPLGLR
jgi:hypothetical protein